MSTESTVRWSVGPQTNRSASLRVTQASTIVIFGATGDLTARKLMPALYRLFVRHLLPASLRVIGVGRRDYTEEAFRDTVRDALDAQRPEASDSQATRAEFVERVGYQRLDFARAEGYAMLAGRVANGESTLGTPGQRLFYLATDPMYFSPIVRALGDVGLARSRADSRVIIEKPFGHNLEAAAELTRDLTDVLDESQIYRIDHYLGKETVQNILSFRFGNAIFEALFNNRYVDHVQITIGESLGMEGRRGRYYDRAGALRDIIQNHGLQLLALAAMEPPAAFTANDVRDEKLKVLRSLKPVSPATDVVRGQYAAGTVGGRAVCAYRDEAGVDPASDTETYVALRTRIDNWRWSGVPFLLRTGKRLPERFSEIAVQFRQPPMNLFTTVECEGDVCDVSDAKPNVLAFRIQPDEGIRLSFSAKRPGMQFQIHPVNMTFRYAKAFPGSLPDAYERLLLDALRGDSTLFTRSDEVEWSWRFVDPILRSWASDGAESLQRYEAGSWGPPATRLFNGCAGTWRTPEHSG